MVTINSIIENNREEELTFYIVYEDLTDEHITLIGNFVQRNNKKIVMIKMEKDKVFSGYKDIEIRLPLESYFYLFAVIELVGVERILYLDADTFCVAPLKALWNSDFEGACIMGRHIDANDTSYERAKASMNPRGNFINSGVVLMDVKAIQSKLKRDNIVAFLKSYSQYHYWYADQIFINTFFENEIKLIDECYNRFCGDALRMWMDETSSKPAVIYHYAGASVKPWHSYNENVYLYNLEDYFRYCDVDEITERFKQTVAENCVRYKNNIWMVMKNRFLRRSSNISQERLLLSTWNRNLKPRNCFKNIVRKTDIRELFYMDIHY